MYIDISALIKQDFHNCQMTNLYISAIHLHRVLSLAPLTDVFPVSVLYFCLFISVSPFLVAGSTSSVQCADLQPAAVSHMLLT